MPLLQQVGHVVDELFGLFPAQAGVGDGLSIDALANLLAAVLQIAFDHDALDHGFQLSIVPAAVKHLPGDADLLQILLAGVVVVAAVVPSCAVLPPPPQEATETSDATASAEAIIFFEFLISKYVPP